MNPVRTAFARYVDDPYSGLVRKAGVMLQGAEPHTARDFVANTVEMMGTPMGIGAPPGNVGLSTLRYALPAAGLTAAGAGLAGLTQRLSDPDETQTVVLLSQ